MLKRGKNLSHQQAACTFIFCHSFTIAVPSSKRSKVADDVEDDEDLWNDNVDKPKKSTSILGGQRQKPTSPVKEVIEEPPSPDRDLMERILQHRNRHGVREIQTETRAERHQRMVNGK